MKSASDCHNLGVISVATAAAKRSTSRLTNQIPYEKEIMIYCKRIKAVRNEAKDLLESLKKADPSDPLH